MKFILDNLYLFAVALISGGMLLWPALKRGSSGASLSPLQATQLINHRNAIVIDVRDEQAFAAGSVTGARNIPFDKLQERIAELSRFKARPAIAVCESGKRSERALATLKAQGFEEAHSLAGGLAAWKQAGLPLVQPTRDTGRAAPKDSGRNRSRTAAKNEARAHDKARAAAKANPRDGTSNVVALNTRAVLDDSAVPAEASPPEAAGNVAPPDRVKEVS